MVFKTAILLQNVSKTYCQGDSIVGTLEVDTDNQEVAHEGIYIHLSGDIAILRSKMSVASEKTTTIPLFGKCLQIVKPGKLPASRAKLCIPFNMGLDNSTTNELFETYHGVNINIQYKLNGEIKRGGLSKKIATSPVEIFLESRPETPLASSEQNKSKNKNTVREFLMTPESINSGRNNNLPAPASLNNIDFEIKGQLDSTSIQMEQPLTGQICIVRTSKAVKSIEIQLIRIEDIPTEEFKQASEVQNIQVATAGPGLVGLYVPLFMVLPRYFSCPSKNTSAFGINFEANISVIFEDNHIVSENIPILLYR